MPPCFRPSFPYFCTLSVIALLHVSSLNYYKEPHSSAPFFITHAFQATSFQCSIFYHSCISRNLIEVFHVLLLTYSKKSDGSDGVCRQPPVLPPKKKAFQLAKCKSNKMNKHTQAKKRKSYLNIGTFNIQGGNSDEKQKHLANDMLKFEMAAISTTKTRIGGGSKVETVRTSCGKFKYKHYTSGGLNKTTRHGVGIITTAETNLDFQAVNERL